MSFGLVLHEKLLDLPDGSVIRDAEGTVYEVDRLMGWDDRIFYSPGNDIPKGPNEIVPPVRLLEGPVDTEDGLSGDDEAEAEEEVEQIRVMRAFFRSTE